MRPQHQWASYHTKEEKGKLGMVIPYLNTNNDIHNINNLDTKYIGNTQIRRSIAKLWAIKPYVELNFIGVNELEVTAHTHDQVVAIFETTPSLFHPNFGLVVLKSDVPRLSVYIEVDGVLQGIHTNVAAPKSKRNLQTTIDVGLVKR